MRDQYTTKLLNHDLFYDETILTLTCRNSVRPCMWRDSLRYSGTLLAWNLYMEESIHWLTLSGIGSRFIFSNSLILILVLSPSFRQDLMHLFWAACKRFFRFLLRLGYQALHAESRKGCTIALHNTLRRRMSKNFSLYNNLNLKFTLCKRVWP